MRVSGTGNFDPWNKVHFEKCFFFGQDDGARLEVATIHGTTVEYPVFYRGKRVVEAALAALLAPDPGYQATPGLPGLRDVNDDGAVFPPSGDLPRISSATDVLFTGYSEAAMRRLQTQAWPGNVRELRNTVERAALLTGGGSVRPEHLGAPGGGADAPPPAQTEVLPLGDRSLRDALMDAMREQPPEGFAEPVERYYEELLR